MEKNLQEDFNNWAFKNGIESTIAFKPEHKLAYEKGKKISIVKDNEHLVIDGSKKEIEIKYVQELKNIEKGLSTDDINELLKGNIVNKVKSYEGDVTAIENNIASVFNAKYGEMKFPINNQNIEVGETVKVDLNIQERKDKKGNEYRVDSYEFNTSNSKDKAQFSTFQMDDKGKVHEVNPEKIVENIESVNNQKLTEKQKVDLIKGRKVNLKDDEIEIYPKENKAIKGKKLLMLATLIVAGPVGFALIKGARMAYKMDKEKRNTLNKSESTRLDELYKEATKKHPDNQSLQAEYKKFKDLKNKEIEFGDLKIEANLENLFNGSKEKIIVKNIEDLFDDINTKKTEAQIIDLEIKSKSGKNVTKVKFDSNSAILKDKELFESFINTKNAYLFKDENLKIEDITKATKKIDNLIKDDKINTSRTERNNDNLKAYIKSMISIAQQKSAAYPQNSQIKKDINILNNSVNTISKVVNVKATKNLSNLNDDDLFQKAKIDKDDETNENKVKKQTFKRRSL